MRLPLEVGTINNSYTACSAARPTSPATAGSLTAVGPAASQAFQPTEQADTSLVLDLRFFALLDLSGLRFF